MNAELFELRVMSAERRTDLTVGLHFDFELQYQLCLNINWVWAKPTLRSALCVLHFALNKLRKEFVI